MYDFIGDIHGHSDELEELLTKLDYKKVDGVYSHSNRKVFFLGDYIDRGPKIKETLEIVKSMVDSGNAFAIMGNHEYNAICFHHQKINGGHLRKHSIKNILQHVETLKQFQNNQELYNYYIVWFLTLPIFWEESTFRATHACWDQSNIENLKNCLTENKLNESLLVKSTDKDSSLYNLLDETLKGKEMLLPDSLSFKDKDGNIRHEIRIKWWLNPAETSFKSYSILSIDGLSDENINQESDFYSENEKPVFFGHYWLQGIPFLIRENICCLDFSVAKGGSLAAYRFDGEKKLDGSKIVYV